MTDYAGTGAMGQGKRDERVIYYRKPNGWITWADSESGTKLRDFSIRGFQPLFNYGAITGYMDKEQTL